MAKVKKEAEKAEELTLEQKIDAVDTVDEKLALLTEELGKQYDLFKASEEAKDLRKVGFFALLTDYIEQKVPLERTTERVVLKQGESIEEALKTRYPDMLVALDSDEEPMMEENPEDDREWIVVLNQNPEFMKFSFVNPLDQMVYSRGRTERGASFDTDGFVAQFPELAEKCVDKVVTLTVPPGADLGKMKTKELLSLSTERLILNEEKAEAMVTVDPTLLSTFMKFRVAPKISMTLLKPRKAKAGEL